MAVLVISRQFRQRPCGQVAQSRRIWLLQQAAWLRRQLLIAKEESFAAMLPSPSETARAPWPPGSLAAWRRLIYRAIAIKATLPAVARER